MMMELTIMETGKPIHVNPEFVMAIFEHEEVTNLLLQGATSPLHVTQTVEQVMEQFF